MKDTSWQNKNFAERGLWEWRARVMMEQVKSEIKVDKYVKVQRTQAGDQTNFLNGSCESEA